MSNNPRDQLKQLVADMRLPMTPEEVDEHLAGMSDEEVELLLPLYQATKNYEQGMEDAAQEANPEAYLKTEEGYDAEQLRLLQKFSHQRENVQSQADHELEILDHQADAKYNKLLYQEQIEMNEIEDEYKDIYSKLMGVLKKQSGQERTGS